MAKRSRKKGTAKAARKTVRRAAKQRTTKRRPAGSRAPSRKTPVPKVRPGLITHTELASADPPATKMWCERVLGWKFGEAVPTPTGPYHMWRFDNATGGGIRANNPPEVPGSIPYCEVADIQAAAAPGDDLAEQPGARREGEGGGGRGRGVHGHVRGVHWRGRRRRVCERRRARPRHWRKGSPLPGGRDPPGPIADGGAPTTAEQSASL